MHVLYVIPQDHVFIVYTNPITTFIVYIITFYGMFYAFDATMFYCTLSEMTRIKDDQSVIVTCAKLWRNRNERKPKPIFI